MRIEINIVTGERTELPDAEVIPKTKAQLKIAELLALAAQYKADTSALQLNFLSAMASDGTAEAARKALIQEDLAAVVAQNAADRAAIVAKYA